MMPSTPHGPQLILLLSGKRKSGKDFVAENLHGWCREQGAIAAIIRLSGPLKAEYAKEHGLDYDRLLDATDYKERYREDMIAWGEAKRRQDHGYFCRLAVQQNSVASEANVWIISDVRRKTDIQYFSTNYPGIVETVRIIASEEIRKKRGYVFTKGIDDAESECDLDDVQQWDYEIINESADIHELDQQLTPLKENILRKLPINGNFKTLLKYC